MWLDVLLSLHLLFYCCNLRICSSSVINYLFISSFIFSCLFCFVPWISLMGAAHVWILFEYFFCNPRNSQLFIVILHQDSIKTYFKLSLKLSLFFLYLLTLPEQIPGEKDWFYQISSGILHFLIRRKNFQYLLVNLWILSCL